MAFPKDESGTACGAAIISDYERTRPLLAFSLTAPDFQKRGIGALLIKLAVDSLHKMQIGQISLVVTSTNESALRLYRQLGFKEAGI
ncbi:MAG: GNAT family N-acetyltransferase [Cyanobacteria bacterium REEB67]|nr:GNAT family N-acetyltransferase [Cyanobacteria bacterium REEB67]